MNNYRNREEFEKFQSQLEEFEIVDMATKFAYDLALVIASELVEKGIVRQASDVDTILLDILEKAGLENNYII